MTVSHLARLDVVIEHSEDGGRGIRCIEYLAYKTEAVELIYSLLVMRS